MQLFDDENQDENTKNRKYLIRWSEWLSIVRVMSIENAFENLPKKSDGQTILKLASWYIRIFKK